MLTHDEVHSLTHRLAALIYKNIHHQCLSKEEKADALRISKIISDYVYYHFNEEK